MPTYDYVCDACGHAFEHFQAMSDRHLKTCPKCRKKKLVRRIGAGAGLIFKGSGFYITDYKKSSSSGSTGGASEGGASPPAAAPPGASTDAKPAAGPASKASGTSSGGRKGGSKGKGAS